MYGYLLKIIQGGPKVAPIADTGLTMQSANGSVTVSGMGRGDVHPVIIKANQLHCTC